MENNIMGRRIKKLREERELSQLDLSKILNVSTSSLSQYESGNRVPSDDVKRNIADYFQVTMDYLVGRTDQPFASVTLTEKNEKNIAKKMRDLREEIENSDGLMFDGEILSDETKDLLLTLLEKDEIAATLNNKKYIPKKYRK